MCSARCPRSGLLPQRFGFSIHTLRQQVRSVGGLLHVHHSRGIGPNRRSRFRSPTARFTASWLGACSVPPRPTRRTVWVQIRRRVPGGCQRRAAVAAVSVRRRRRRATRAAASRAGGCAPLAGRCRTQKRSSFRVRHGVTPGPSAVTLPRSSYGYTGTLPVPPRRARPGL